MKGWESTRYMDKSIDALVALGRDEFPLVAVLAPLF